MTILKGKEPKDVIAIFVIALVISILVYLAVITVYPKETYYFNKTSINGTVRKIDVQLNFQVYVNDKLVVNKWNNGLTKNFIVVIYISLKQSYDYITRIDGASDDLSYFYSSYHSFHDDMFVRLGNTTYHSGVAYDLYNIASSTFVEFHQFPTVTVTVKDNYVEGNYTWEYTSSSSFTFYEVGIFRDLYSSTYGWHVKYMLIYEDIPEGVSVDPDDVVKIVVSFRAERGDNETFTKLFFNNFISKIFKDYSSGEHEIWADMQYRYIIIGKDCFSTDCASSGEICSSNYIELHHEDRTYYTNADKTRCTVELKVSYTPDTNVIVKEICWGFSNTNVGYCKKFDTTLQANVPYVIKVLITFPTG